MSTSVAPVASDTSAPAVAAAPAVERNFSQMISKVAAQTTVAPDPTPVQESVAIVRDPAPKPDAPASPDLPPGTQPPVTDAPPSDDGPEAAAPETAPVAAEPTGEVTLEDEGITLRAERNADGTFKTKLDPNQKMDLEFRDKDTGEIKKYTKTMPEILRLAKDGVALQTKVQSLTPEVQYYREKLPQWQRDFADVQQQLDDMTALNTELLTAEEHLVVQRREEFAKRNGPEERLKRLEREKQEREAAERQTTARRQVAVRAQSFVQTKLSAAVKEAEAVLGVEAVAGKIAMATAPLLVDGVIPPERWSAVEQYINGPFKQWFATEAAKRKAADDALSLSKKETDEARRRAQAAINESGRAAAPIGSAAPDRPAALPKPKNTQEAMHRLINRPLPATV